MLESGLRHENYGGLVWDDENSDPATRDLEKEIELTLMNLPIDGMLALVSVMLTR